MVLNVLSFKFSLRPEKFTYDLVTENFSNGDRRGLPLRNPIVGTFIWVLSYCNWKIIFFVYFTYSISDFKVTAMNEEELRKSVRRQKFEKVGLTINTGNNGSNNTANTGTGTGTSDTEDEGSTPTGENADRSLASTMGGSAESIPQVSSSFLQAALEGPGTILERGNTGSSDTIN